MLSVTWAPSVVVVQVQGCVSAALAAAIPRPAPQAKVVIGLPRALLEYYFTTVCDCISAGTCLV
ncbi:hypothetical protein SUDANB180_00047 [Streptomyces sp. enrichment culture]